MEHNCKGRKGWARTKSAIGADLVESLMLSTPESELPRHGFCKIDSKDAAKLTDPGFLERLYRTGVEHLFQADRFNDSSGRRFPKETVGGPVFCAVAWLRSRYRQEQTLQWLGLPRLEAIPSDEARDRESKALLSNEFVSCVEKNNVGRLRDLVSLCRLYEELAFERQRRQDKEALFVPWHFYIATAAEYLLRRCKGIPPTKSFVVWLAKRWRAMDEVSTRGVPYKKRDEAFRSKLKELTVSSQRQLTRIFSDLGLSDLGQG